MRAAVLFIILLRTKCQGFVSGQQRYSENAATSLIVFEKKQKKVVGSSPSNGFGSNSKSKGFVKTGYEKTYNQKSFETFEGMDDFFTRNADWLPLFASVSSITDDLLQAPAAKYLQTLSSSTTELEYSDKTPWVTLPRMPIGPDKDKHMKAIAHVLDKTQIAMLEIPDDVDDSEDLNFVEEGRRILVLNRFHVLEAVGKDDFRSLFQTCWSEIYCLINDGTPGTGSLIILDDELEEDIDLSQFVQTNIRLPLKWLGISDECLEVANFTRGKKCIRLIHKLGMIPDLRARDQALEEEKKSANKRIQDE